MPSSTLIERLSNKIQVSDDGCLEWTGALRMGYGKFRGNAGATTSAHRVVWETFVGPIPKGMDLDHLCRNRRCVNPDHLEPVTRRENLMRGKTKTAENAAKTHCVHGHEYTPENTVIKDGWRNCRACKIIQQRAWKARQCR